MNTDTLASNLIVAAFDVGARIDMDYARCYIAAREILQRDRGNEAAQATVDHFELLMSVFGRFTLTFEDYEKHFGELDSGKETNQEYRDRVLAHFARIPPLEIVQKCAPYFRPHADVEGWKEGIRVFMQRTGLTVAQIEQMTPGELAAHA